MNKWAWFLIFILICYGGVMVGNFGVAEEHRIANIKRGDYVELIAKVDRYTDFNEANAEMEPFSYGAIRAKYYGRDGSIAYIEVNQGYLQDQPQGGKRPDKTTESDKKEKRRFKS